jgi:hypothetical protein
VGGCRREGVKVQEEEGGGRGGGGAAAAEEEGRTGRVERTTAVGQMGRGAQEWMEKQWMGRVRNGWGSPRAGSIAGGARVDNGAGGGARKQQGGMEGQGRTR